MEKFGIITHYDVHNHGALLQLTALIKVLENLGIEAKALRFDKNYDFMGYKMKAKYNPSLQSLGIYLKYIISKGINCTFYNYLKSKTLSKYKKDKEIVGDYYSESPNLDCVIIGSDEVFALHTGPTPVFFGYCLPTEKVISYAGSFGPTKLKEIHQLHATNFVSSGLKNMKHITVRDINSSDIIQNLIDYRPTIVVDPVLLYGFKNEINILKSPKIKNYLLVYAYDNRMNSKEEIEFIKNYAKSKNLKIVSAGFYHSWCNYNIDVDPINLLSYFKNAFEVITDTFHGSIMSIITNAKFIVKTREENHFKLKSLLNEFDLEDRILENWKNINEVMEPNINYKKINDLVEKRRHESLNELICMIKN